MAVSILRDYENDTAAAKAYHVDSIGGVTIDNYKVKLKGKKEHIEAFENYLRALSGTPAPRKKWKKGSRHGNKT